MAMDCSLCGSPVGGDGRCLMCGTPVHRAGGPTSAASRAAGADRLAELIGDADAVIARAGAPIRVTSAQTGPRPHRPEPAVLLARATSRVRQLGTMPAPSGLPVTRRSSLLLRAGSGLRVEVEGPRRGPDGPLQLHYASLHAGEQFPYRLALHNEDFRALDAVVVTLQIPRYSALWSRTLRRLERSAPHVVEDVRLDLDLERMRSLLEADTRSQLDVRVEAAGQLRHAESIPLEVLAWREWRYDLTERPEALASFVQPNDGEITGVLSAVSERLQDVAGDYSLCGYQKPASAGWPLMMTLAIHHALQAAGVRYINPPASFERGQKIRLPGDVLRGRMGTCLDLAILWCSLLEAVGLHPVLVVVDGHAFQGVWLEPLNLAEPWTDELQPVLDAFAAGKLLLFNSTTFTDGSSGLDAAVDQAIDCLAGTPFRCLVDVGTARAAGVRPLP